jgi:uncharacterized protein (TIGR02001 family)
MKKIALLLATFAVGSSAFAAETAKTALSVTVDQTIVNEYIFRGAAFSDFTFHPSIEAKYGDAYVGAWGAFEGNDSGSGASSNYKELDLYAGYGFALADGWSLDIGATSYQYLGGNTNNAQSFEPYIGVSGTVAGLTTTAYLYHDLDVGTYTAQTSVGYSIPLESIGTSLDLTGTLGYQVVGGDESDVVGASDSYFYYSIGAAIPYKLAENATLTAGVTFVGASENEFAANEYGATIVNDFRPVVSLGLSIGF